MQCLSRKKDEEFLQFFVLFLLVGILIFILLYRRSLSLSFFMLYVLFDACKIETPYLVISKTSFSKVLAKPGVKIKHYPSLFAANKQIDYLRMRHGMLSASALIFTESA